MDDELYGLSATDVTVLRQVIRAYKSGQLSRPLQQSARPYGERSSVIFGVVDAALDGTTGAVTDPGSGTMSVYKFTSTAGTSDSGLNETVYNLSTVAKTTGEYTVAVRDYQSGKFMAVAGSGGSTYKKQFCRFVLDHDISVNDATAAALLTDQYGEGTAHSTGAITVKNTLDGATTGYLFDGSSGTAGLAVYDTSTSWVIFQLYRSCTT